MTIVSKASFYYIHFETTKSLYTEKTIFPFPFTLNGTWSWWQFSFRFWIKWKSIWLKSKGKLSPRSCPIQCERNLKYSFLSVWRIVQLVLTFETGEVFEAPYIMYILPSWIIDVDYWYSIINRIINNQSWIIIDVDYSISCCYGM